MRMPSFSTNKLQQTSQCAKDRAGFARGTGEGQELHNSRDLQDESRPGRTFAERACGRFVLVLLLAFASLTIGCGTVPDVNALLHTNPVDYLAPSFVGPHGAVTARQGEQIIARLEKHQEVPSDILKRQIVFEQALSDVPLTLGNKVILLENGAQTYNAMLAAIRSAQSSVNIQMFIFSDGQVGQIFAEALIDRQHHGVQVNLMYDSLGSLSTPAAFFDRMRQNGIAALEYRPLDPFAAKLDWTFSHRNHRKMVIVDGRIAFTGGVNISEDYASGLKPSEHTAPLQLWRDTDIEVQGPAVAEFQKTFIGEWYYQKGPLLSPREYFPKVTKRGNDIVRVVASVPERFSLIYVTIVSAIANAETNIYITDAYFAPDHQMLQELESAARRGVDVRLVLPSQSDEPFIVSAERSHYDDLLRSGVKIYEWQGKMLHAKTATVDGIWSTVGTSNLDWWSIVRDNELNGIILSHSFAQQMNLMFSDDLEHCRRITLEEWERRGLNERLQETAAWMIEPLL
jgi:cardiolipin synthase A/B